MAGPYPPVPNCLKVMIQGTVPGEIWENVLHFGYLGPPPSVSSCVTFAQAIGTQWSVHLSPLQPVEVIQTNVVALDMSGTSAAEGVAALNTPGTRAAGGHVPANSAVLISYPSPARFRGGHFRTYLVAGVTTDMSSPMSWSTTFAGGVSTAWQAFIGSVIGVSAAGTQIQSLIGLRQHGKFLPNAGPPNYVLTTPIQLTLSATDIVVHTQIASQKGRIGRRSK